MELQADAMHVAILNGVGGIVKHLTPWKAVNRFIPLINFGIAGAMHLAKTGDLVAAAAGGLTEALLATGAHKSVQQVKGLNKV